MNEVAKVIAEVEKTNYLTRLATEEHFILADEPIADGGENKGMNPMELLASSLASCTGITLKMYVNRKGWNITNIKVEVVMKKRDNEYFFEKQISFTGADEEQKKRMLTIADLCPVNKILSKSLKIESKLGNYE